MYKPCGVPHVGYFEVGLLSDELAEFLEAVVSRVE
jgi:hypothetical protein